jgi:GntR family transcriptional regulator
VLDDLEDRLASGEISDRFPTDRELVEHYEVSRHTVREAVRRLRGRGIISRERGRGSFVNADVLEQPVGTLYSLFREVEQRGQEQRSEVLELRHCEHAETAARLGLDADAPLVVLARLRLADDHPLAMDTVWLPADVGEALLDVDMRRTALYDELEQRAGITIDQTEERIETVVPDENLRQLLELEDDEGVFRVARLGSSSGRPVEWRVTLVRGGRFAFVSQWQRHGAPTAPRFESS